MTQRYQSKIRPDASIAPLNWHTLGPGEPALTEWADLGLKLPDMDVVRRYRLQRVREQLAAHDYAGIVLSDPLNVRYATSSTNMQVWTLHNAARIASSLPKARLYFSSSPMPTI